MVKIPIPNDLKGKDLTVYHIADNEAKEYTATIEGDYVVFRTKHYMRF